MGLFVSTTGADVVISELGITIPNPTTDFDVGSQFSDEDVKHADSLTTAIRNGTLVWRKVAAGAVQTPTDYDPEWLEIEAGNTGTGAAADQVVKRSDITNLGVKPKYKYRMTAIQLTTSVTPAFLTQLTSGSLPIGNYVFKVYAKVQSAAASNGYGVRLSNGTATIVDLLAAWQLPTNADFSTQHFNSYAQNTVGENNITGTIGAANTDYMVIGQGFFSVSVAGTVGVQVRSEANGTAVTFGVGSYLEIEEI
jgi:hypothetical protein